MRNRPSARGRSVAPGGGRNTDRAPSTRPRTRDQPLTAATSAKDRPSALSDHKWTPAAAVDATAQLPAISTAPERPVTRVASQSSRHVPVVATGGNTSPGRPKPVAVARHARSGFSRVPPAVISPSIRPAGGAERNTATPDRRRLSTPQSRADAVKSSRADFEKPWMDPSKRSPSKNVVS
jgi:hypothetical protein